jgi:AraC-like DNA-binding protein
MNVIQEYVVHPHESFRVLRLGLDAFRGGRHRHRHLELTWIESGTGLRYVGDSVQPYAAGDLVLLGPNVPHAWISSLHEACKVHRATVIQFAPELLATPLLPELATARAMAEDAGQGLLVGVSARSAITDAIARIPRRPGLSALSAFIEVLGQLELHRPSMTPIASQAVRSMAASHTEQDRRIARVIEWMHLNLAHELRLGDAARLAHITPSAFSRYFSREVGKSFTEYINDIRCGETCLLLRSTDRSVSAIASECGFETLSHFNRQFRQRLGMSPREFRSRA